ncbi:MAG: hypothetical protein IKT55_02585 [Clostridia bacterium]|nr:hypothetical protein [Clostridia bacterium]
MRTKKAIAVLLAVVILAIPFAVVSSASSAIVSAPIKTQYTDCEYFNPQGLVVEYEGKEVAYSPIDPDFAFSPALNEYLTVGTNSDGDDLPTNTVEVYYKNEFVGTVEIEVSHVLGEITFLSEAGHGQYCLGCGKVHNYSEHNIPEYIPNDDGGIFLAQTETGTCLDCGGKVTRNIPGTEGFVSIFGGEMTDLESTVIGYIYTILVSLVQALAGIR